MANHSDNELDRQLETVMKYLMQLLKAFRFERFIFLGIGVLGVVLLTIAVSKIILSDSGANIGTLVTVFGSGGLYGIAGAGTTYYYNKSYDAIYEVIKKFGGTQ